MASALTAALISAVDAMDQSIVPIIEASVAALSSRVSKLSIESPDRRPASEYSNLVKTSFSRYSYVGSVASARTHSLLPSAPIANVCHAPSCVLSTLATPPTPM